ncbi:UDP-N-acetylmuramoyl-L-alanine--D-glutamate ligase [Angustibacter sp. McL0619]|uniref:UDP-N-acetylmuramoyl-L-alanine--D-glutamate ligase n=1 Tax=Angustibacter sp. McL0619 TaxID=3415676 RepID=UPI003CF163A5
MSDAPGRLDGLTDRDADWAGLQVVVAGLAVSGFAAADALLQRGARLVVLDGRDGPQERERAEILRIMGADVRLGESATTELPGRPDLVVTSPGWRPAQPVLAAAAAAGVPVWGEVELAWRMRPAHGGPPWLTLTGTNGKTTTVHMLTSMLRAAGLRAAAVGNVGTPILHAVLAEEPLDVLAVELSSFQLHWLGPDRARSVAPLASAVLNVEPDHLDWHGSFEAYLKDKGDVYERTEVACVYNVQDPRTEQLVRDADVTDGCRAIGFTRGSPSVGMVGVVDDVLADRAFVVERRTSAAELGTLADVQGDSPVLAPHQVSNALAAAALARAAGVAPSAVRDGLRGFRPEPHRIAHVATVDGISFVDDSKATNPPAAAAALATFEHVVWVAGGLLKGADVDDLVRVHAGRLRAVVLIGRDREQIARAIARHAPDVPVVEVDSTETGLMDDVVRRAASLARAGDTVLLAPAAASMDQFRDYAQRGEEFAAAVHRFTRSRQGE